MEWQRRLLNLQDDRMTLTIISDTDFLSSSLKIERKKMGILDSNDIATIIRDLKEKDYYEFSEEEEHRLTN